MKKIIGLLVCLTLTLTCFIGITTHTGRETNVKTRTAIASVEESNYFDSFEETQSETDYKAVAKKTISSAALKEYETVSLFDDEEYLITYEVETDSENSNVVLNVYFDKTNERIIENFTGYPTTNYNDEKDILFIVDGMHVFLSELANMSALEQCSWFGNILHKVLNAGMIAVSYLEPAVKVLVYTSENIYVSLYNIVKNTSYLVNFGINSSKTQPTGYVYGQDAYENWRFGFTNMSEAGCEVIAGYNLAHAKGRNITLADTIFLYESLGIEIGLAQGFFGSNPYQISYFLASTGLWYNKVFNYKTFENYMKDSNNYYIILSRWNDEGAGAMIHTFMIDKDTRYSKKFHAYNSSGNYSDEISKKTKDTNNYKDFFRGKINNTFICAYFVAK